MKHLLLALLLALSVLPCSSAELPEEVLVGTDMVAAAKFKAWKAEDPTAYSGTYSGDTGGDTGANLEIRVTKNKGAQAEIYPFGAAGTFQQQTVEMKPAVLTFSNAYFEADEYASVSISSFEIIFVSYNKQKGVVINGAFIPRE